MHEQLGKCGARTPQSQNYYRSKFSRDNSRQNLPYEYLSLRCESLSPNINCSIFRSYGQESLRSASIDEKFSYLFNRCVGTIQGFETVAYNLRCRRPGARISVKTASALSHAKCIFFEEDRLGTLTISEDIYCAAAQQ
jgi:hypothetical protein